MFRRDWLREQVARAIYRVNKCNYRNRRSRLYMPEEYINEKRFLRSQVQGQHDWRT